MVSCIILAAGEGKRLRPYTQNCPKCTVPFLNKPLIFFQDRTLKSVGIENISIVTGYEAQQLEYLDYQSYHNHAFHRTNMVHSLLCAREALENALDDIIISYGDIVYEQNNLEKVLQASGDITVMIDDEWYALWSIRNEDPMNDAETLKLNEHDDIIEIGKKPKSLKDIQGQYTGLFKISHSKISELLAFYDQLDRYQSYDGKDFWNMYMTTLLQLLIDNGWNIKPVHVQNGWLEIDTVTDLLTYENMEAEGRLKALWDKNA